MANNNIGRESMLAFTDELMSNSVLQTLLLKDNPGLDVHIASVMYAAIQRNTMDVTTDTTREVVEDLELRHSSGYRRLELQTPRIALLLRTWQQLQHIETSVPQMAYPHIHAAASTTSAATMGSNSPTAIAIRSRKNIRAAAAAKSSTTSASASASKSGTPKVGTRKAFEAELRAHLSNPYGYSALDLANDQAPSAPVSPYRQSKSGEYSYASFLNNAVSPAGIGLFTGRPNRSQAQFSGLLDGRSSLHRSFMSQQQDHDGPEEVDPNASTSRFNMVDLQQPLFASGRSTGSGIGGYAGGGTGGVVGNPLSDSIQLSVNSRDDLAVEDHSQLGSARDRDFALTGEALDLAIPTVSPVKSSSDYYIGMDAKRPPKNPELHSQAENDEEDQQQVREESWGNIDWPVSDDHQGYNHTENDDNLLSGRPPSRISIRHHRSSSCSNGGRSSSPSPDRVDGAYSAQKRELQLRMRQEMDDYAMEQYAESYAAGRPIPAHRHRTSTTPEILRSSSHASFAATSEPNYRRHTNSSASGAVNKPGTKPFYAGGQARPASPVKYTRAELAVLYGLAPSSRSLPRQQQDMRYSSPYVERRKKIIKRRRSAPTGRVREALPSSAVPVVLGKARGSTGTRIRARSADRLGRGVGGVDSRTAVGGHDSSSSSGVRSSVRVINELSVTVLNATRNLETVSTKLKDVIEGLSTSMDMNLTIQRELLSNSMMNTTTNTTFMNSNTSTGTGGVKSSHAWASPVGLSSVNATPQSHALFHRPPLSGVKTSPAEGPSSSQSTGGAGSKVAASRYRDLSSSPVTFNGAAHHQQESSGIECGQGANGHRVDRESTGGSEPLFAPRDANDSQEQEQEQDSQLRELVRNRMEQKLRSILNENS